MFILILLLAGAYKSSLLGRYEKSDPSLLYTALRESQEEVSLPINSVAPLTSLKPFISRNFILVHPFIGLVPSDFEPCPNLDEVADCFWVPLRYFLSIKYSGLLHPSYHPPFSSSPLSSPSPHSHHHRQQQRDDLTYNSSTTNNSTSTSIISPTITTNVNMSPNTNTTTTTTSSTLIVNPSLSYHQQDNSMTNIPSTSIDESKKQSEDTEEGERMNQNRIRLETVLQHSNGTQKNNIKGHYAWFDIDWNGGPYRIHQFWIQGYEIFGLTAHILMHAALITFDIPNLEHTPLSSLETTNVWNSDKSKNPFWYLKAKGQITDELYAIRAKGMNGEYFGKRIDFIEDNDISTSSSFSSVPSKSQEFEKEYQLDIDKPKVKL